MGNLPPLRRSAEQRARAAHPGCMCGDLRSYNPAAMKQYLSLLRYALTAFVLALVGVLAASCDYPEQGFFLLTALDANGQPVSKHLFEIHELTDDTDLTTGF